MNFKPTLWKVIFSIIIGLFLGNSIDLYFLSNFLKDNSNILHILFGFIFPIVFVYIIWSSVEKPFTKKMLKWGILGGLIISFVFIIIAIINSKFGMYCEPSGFAMYSSFYYYLYDWIINTNLAECMDLTTAIFSSIGSWFPVGVIIGALISLLFNKK